MTSAPGSNFSFDRYAGAGNNGRRREQVREPLGKLFDKEPPFSVEAEQCLLGSMILDPRVIPDVLPLVRSGESFYDPGRGIVFDVVTSLYDKLNAIDRVMLMQALRDKGVLESVGGERGIIELAEAVPTAVNAPHFARIVAEKHKLRKLIDAAGQILFDTYHAGQVSEHDAKQLIDRAEQQVFEIAQEEQISDVEKLDKLLQAEYERLMDLDEGKHADKGVSTGFIDLDEMLGGMQAGEMIIIAARPSMGKTAFTLNIAEQMALGTIQPGSTHAVRDMTPVGVFSLEMSKSALAQRLLSSWSGINAQKIRSGHLSKRAPNDEYKVLLDAAQQLGQAPIYIDDTPSLSITALRARARRMVAQHKIKAIMIDYLQLLTAPQQAKESRQVEVSSISRGVKALARELKVPIIALSQLNRGPEGREGNKPRLSDLRESGSLEQDADVVLLLHREEYYHVQDEDWKANNPDKIGLAEIIVAKQRNGPTGIVKLAWDSETTRFKNWTPDHGSYTPPPRVHTPEPVAPEPKPMPARSGGWHAGSQRGPVENHRDGGGPDRDESPAMDPGLASPFAGDDEAPF
jgi:replicative DNA helicase